LTTFSSWQLQVFDAWINAQQVQRSGLANVGSSLPFHHIVFLIALLIQFLDGVTLTTITLSLSLASLSFGKKLASLCVPRFQRPPFLPPFLRYGLSCFSILIYAATLITYFFLPSSYRHIVTAALIFSFPGTLTRYLLSTALNTRLKAFPLGTLVANILGTALLAAFHILQSTPSQPSRTRCDIMQGLVDGYCGCLTTISTFAAELGDLMFWKACRYALISWILSQVAMLLIFGSSLWSGSVEKQVTCSYFA
jgi:fluoride ion exporter CrcB/FEX